MTLDAKLDHTIFSFAIKRYQIIHSAFIGRCAHEVALFFSLCRQQTDCTLKGWQHEDLSEKAITA